MKMVNKLDSVLIGAQMKANAAKMKACEALDKAKKGDIAFEYVIILVIMSAVIFVGWRYLGNTVTSQISKVSDTMNKVGATY